MKNIFYVLIFLSLLSCRDNSPTAVDTVASEYQDWYVLKAPMDRAIEGVWGDIDKTVIISTMFTIYRTTDRGKTWQQVLKTNVGIPGIVQYQDTLFTMSGMASMTDGAAFNQMAIHPNFYSLDDGRTWTTYKKPNPVFELSPPPGTTVKRFPINYTTASNATTYRINQVFLDGPNATSGSSETPGVVTQTGRRIDLPNLHHLICVNLDSQERLYISGSDAVCGRGQNFRFCNSQGGRGVVYVSKKPRP